MKQEEKELLLKDLCARLPYGVKCKYFDCCEGDYDEGTICGFERQEYIQIDGVCIYIEDVKPYLFPLSSMTEEQKNKCFKGTPLEIDKYGDIAVKDDFFGGCQYTDLEIYLEVINWLLKNHFDIYGLIPMGLAIDATGLNIY